MRTSARGILRPALLSALLSGLLALFLTPLAPLAPATSAQPPPPHPDCTLDELLVNPCRPLLGAYSNHYPGISGWRAHIDAEEARIGRPLDIVHRYHPPGEAGPLIADEIHFATRPNTIMFANWKPALSAWSSAGGGNATVNAQIDKAADSIKSIAPTKIMLTIHHEAEPDVTPGTSSCPHLKGKFGSPADYRAMWRNVHERFAARGVTNVVWVMNYMGYKNWDCLAPELWPGNDLVDWVMYDPYQTVSSSSWSTSVSRFYNWMLANSDATHDYVSKVWGLAEFGAGGQTTQADAYTYYDDARASVERNEFPRLKAYVVFDSEGTLNNRTSYSVSGVYDPVEQEHFNAFANSSAFLDPPAPPTDTTAPTVTLVRPTTGDSVSGSVEIEAAVADDRAVTGATYAVDGGVSRPLTLGADGTASATWDSSSAQDGERSLVVSATDAAGNTGTAAVGLTVANQDTTPPSTPRNLRTVSLRSDTVELAWDAATDATGVSEYVVTRDGSQLWTGTGTEVTDSTAVASTAYTYTVTARDAAGNASPTSTELRVTTPALTDTEPPTTPELTAVAAGSDAALSWTEATDDTGVAGYRVFRGATLLSTVDAATRAYTDTSVEQGRSLRYTVEAFDLAGNTSQPSTAADLTLPDATAPSAPRNPTAYEQPLLGGVFVSWQASTDNVAVSGYSVYRDGTALGTVATPGFIDQTVGPGTTYVYTVEAYDAVGNLSPAGTAQVTTADTVAPTAPLRPSASLTGSTVNLSWPDATDDVGVQGYRVLRDGSAIADVTGTTYQDATAPQGVAHRYAVVAYDDADNLSAASPELTVTVPDTTAPAKPAAPVVSRVSGKVALSWTAPSDNVGITEYLLKRNGSSLTTTTGRTWTDATPVQGRTSTYTVTAFDAAGNASAASSSASVWVPDTTAPSRPTSFKVVAGIGRATLTWAASTDNVGVKGYQVYRGTTRLTTTAGRTYTNTGLTKGKAYTYKVRAYDAKGNLSPYTGAITVTAR